MKKTQKVLNFSVFQLNRETLFFITPSGCYLIVKKKKNGGEGDFKIKYSVFACGEENGNGTIIILQFLQRTNLGIMGYRFVILQRVLMHRTHSATVAEVESSSTFVMLYTTSCIV